MSASISGSISHPEGLRRSARISASKKTKSPRDGGAMAPPSAKRPKLRHVDVPQALQHTLCCLCQQCEDDLLAPVLFAPKVRKEPPKIDISKWGKPTPRIAADTVFANPSVVRSLLPAFQQAQASPAPAF